MRSRTGRGGRSGDDGPTPDPDAAPPSRRGGRAQSPSRGVAGATVGTGRGGGTDGGEPALAPPALAAAPPAREATVVAATPRFRGNWDVPLTARGRPLPSDLRHFVVLTPPDQGCPNCRAGRLQPRGAKGRKAVRDWPYGPLPVHLTIEFQACWACPDCGLRIKPKAAWIDPGCVWTEPWLPVTPRLARYLEEELRHTTTVTDLSRRTAVTRETINELIDRIGKDVRHAARHDLLPAARIVGLDGKILGKRKFRLLVATDLERQKLLWCAPGEEDTASIVDLIRSLPQWRDIEIFVIDFAPGFEAAIREAYQGLPQPGIVRCLAHVARLFLDAGHGERRRLARRRARGKLPPLNRIFTLRLRDMAPSHRALLRKLKDSKPTLFKAYCFKEAVYGVFAPGVTAAVVRARFARLRRWMQRDPEMASVFRAPMDTVTTHLDQILRGLEPGAVATNNGAERINGGLDALNAATKGLAWRQPERFLVRALLRHGGLTAAHLDAARAARLALEPPETDRPPHRRPPEEGRRGGAAAESVRAAGAGARRRGAASRAC